MKIISRQQWGARYDRGFGPAPLPARAVWLHHSVTIAPDLVWVDVDGDGVEDDEERAMRLLEQIGEDRFGGGISYTFAVMPSGRVYDGHGVDRQGAHTKGLNSSDRAIVWVGDYNRFRPTDAQVRATAGLLRYGVTRGWWRTAALAGGHQQAPGASTACPGRYGMAALGTINQYAREVTSMTTPAQVWGYENNDVAGVNGRDAYQLLADIADNTARLREVVGSVPDIDARLDRIEATLARLEVALEAAPSDPPPAP